MNLASCDKARIRLVVRTVTRNWHMQGQYAMIKFARILFPLSLESFKIFMRINLFIHIRVTLISFNKARKSQIQIREKRALRAL